MAGELSTLHYKIIVAAAMKQVQALQQLQEAYKEQ